MRIALDKDGKKVFIDNTEDGCQYFCQTCNEPLVIRRGQIRAHHFAHFPGTECTDNWHYEEMSDWHIEWQNRFPVDNQEVVMTKNGEKHRVDVFIDNTVIEFQHSPISREEFNERNRFYSSFGYKIIWVFDATDDYRCGLLAEPKFGGYDYDWNRPRSNLTDFDLDNNKDISIMLHIDDTLYGDDDTNPMHEHNLIQIVGTGKNLNYKKLYVNWPTRREQYFLRTKNMNSYSELYDDLAENCICNVDNSRMYLGCPISDASIAFDVSKDKMIPSCCSCKYYKNTLECHYVKEVLNICEKDEIAKIIFNDNNLISDVIIKRDGELKAIHINRKPVNGKTIKEIWNSVKSQSGIIVYNYINKRFYRIKKDPNETDRIYHKVYGQYSCDFRSFSKDSGPIYGFYKPIWIFIEKAY